jgi:hypothetical protein
MILNRFLLVAATGALVALRSLDGSPVGDPTAQSTGETICCFNNPAYSGTCRVEPAKDENCASILAYLNNPMSDGKAYCGGTKVRRGWQEVKCEEETGRDSGSRSRSPAGALEPGVCRSAPSR